MTKKVSSSKDIKPKSNWHYSIKPLAPSAPRKPLKVYSRQEFIEYYHFYENQIKLSDIPLPEGIQLSEMVVEIIGDGQELRFGVYNTVEYPNHNYQKELKEYNKEYAKYQEDKLAYEQELVDWEAWAKQEKKRMVQEEIARAEKILKKHGRLK